MNISNLIRDVTKQVKSNVNEVKKAKQKREKASAIKRRNKALKSIEKDRRKAIELENKEWRLEYQNEQRAKKEKAFYESRSNDNVIWTNPKYKKDLKNKKLRF